MSATKFLIILVALAVLVTGGYLGFKVLDRLSMGLAIAHFRASPSQTGAETLAALVDDGSATSGQVEHILPLLLRPKVTTEQAYPLGEVARIRVERPYEVVFENFLVDANEFVWVDGESQYGTGMTGARTLGTNPHPLHLHPKPTEPGTYIMEVRYTYRLRPRRVRLWRWNPDQGIFWPRREYVDVPESQANTPKYKCTFSVPVDVVVVRMVPLQQRSGTAGK